MLPFSRFRFPSSSTLSELGTLFTWIARVVYSQVLAPVLALVLVGCGASFSQKSGEDLKPLPKYRPLAQGCGSVRWAQADLSGEQVVAIANCLNGGPGDSENPGALQPFVDFLNEEMKASSELDGVARWVDKNILKDPNRLSELEAGFRYWNKNGNAPYFYKGIAKVLKSYPDSQVGSSGGIADGVWLKAIAELLIHMAERQPEKTMQLVDAFLRPLLPKDSNGVPQSPEQMESRWNFVLSTLLQGLKHPALEAMIVQLKNSNVPAEVWVSTLETIAKDTRLEDRTLFEVLDRMSKDGFLAKASRHWLGNSESEWKSNILPVEHLAFRLMQNESKRLVSVRELVTEFYPTKTGKTISCFSGSLHINPLEIFLQETEKLKASGAAELFSTNIPSMLLASPGACQYPGRTAKAVADFYGIFEGVGPRPAGEALIELVQLLRSQKLGTGSLDSLFEFIKKEDLLALLPLASAAVRDPQHLAPIAEMLLWSTQFQPHQVERFLLWMQDEWIQKRNAEFLIAQLRTSLQNDQEFWKDLFKGFNAEYVSALSSLLEGVRRAGLQDSGHPFLSVVDQAITEYRNESGTHVGNPAVLELAKRFFRSPHYPRMAKRLAELAEDEEGLQKLLQSIVELFVTDASQKLANQVKEKAIPAADIKFIHQLTRASLTLKGHAGGPNPLLIKNSCELLGFEKTVESQWRDWKACTLQNPSADAKILVEVLDQLQETSNSGGNSGLEHLMSWVRGISLSPEAWKGFWKAAAEDFRKSEPWQSVTRSVDGILEAFSVTDTFGAMAKVMAKVDGGMIPLENWTARFLKETNFLDTLRGLRKLDEVVTVPDVQPSFIKDNARIARWVRNKECGNWELPLEAATPLTSDQQQRVDRRVEQIIRDYEEAQTSWEWSAEQGTPYQKGSFRKSWNIEQLKEVLDPALARIEDLKRSREDLPLVTGLLNVLRRFPILEVNDPKRQDPEKFASIDDLIRWIYLLSTDYQMETYFYPLSQSGTTVPFARLVSSMDRLELLLLNADVFIGNSNLAIEFLDRVGESWGDEPREEWPDVIKMRADRGDFENERIERKEAPIEGMDPKAPPTFAETFSRIEKVIADNLKRVRVAKTIPCEQLVNSSDPLEVQERERRIVTSSGVLASPVLAAKMHNAVIMSQVLKEMMPKSGRPIAGSIRILRNLFFEVAETTPVEHRRNWKEKNKHNLGVIIELIQSGMMRKTAQQVRKFNLAFNRGEIVALSSDAMALRDWFRFLAHSVQVKQAGKPLADQFLLKVFASGGREAFWKFMEQWLPYSESEGSDLRAARGRRSRNLSQPNIVGRSAISNLNAHLLYGVGFLGKSVEVPHSVGGLDLKVMTRPQDLIPALLQAANRMDSRHFPVLFSLLESLPQWIDELPDAKWGKALYADSDERQYFLRNHYLNRILVGDSNSFSGTAVSSPEKSLALCGLDLAEKVHSEFGPFWTGYKRAKQSPAWPFQNHSSAGESSWEKLMDFLLEDPQSEPSAAEWRGVLIGALESHELSYWSGILGKNPTILVQLGNLFTQASHSGALEDWYQRISRILGTSNNPVLTSGVRPREDRPHEHIQRKSRRSSPHRGSSKTKSVHR